MDASARLAINTTRPPRVLKIIEVEQPPNERHRHK
jgi:hypothetical protein